MRSAKITNSIPNGAKRSLGQLEFRINDYLQSNFSNGNQL